MSSINKIIIIYNPASTNASHFKRRTAEIENFFPEKVPIIKLETSKEGRQANRDIVLKNKRHLGAETLLCIAAGDGTVNLMIETLLTDPRLSDKARKTIILPLWGGNANDLGHMLNGYSHFVKIRKILKQGRTVRIRPLHITLSNKNDRTVLVAACYASFGATAYAAHKINHPSHRGSHWRSNPVLRLVLELRTVVKAFVEVPRFDLEEQGHVKRIYEYAFINGSRIAKFERMPIRLTDNAFYIVRILRKHPKSLLYVFQIIRKQRFGKITSNRHSFIIRKSTYLQFDGEVLPVKAGTKVEIALGKSPFYAQSLRLRNED